MNCCTFRISLCVLLLTRLLNPLFLPRSSSPLDYKFNDADAEWVAIITVRRLVRYIRVLTKKSPSTSTYLKNPVAQSRWSFPCFRGPTL
ncbi:hypothetical protein C8J55DRAFT_503500, partial [Lentinula edodes]